MCRSAGTERADVRLWRAQSRVMTRPSSDTLKCLKAPYILYGCAVYLTELLVVPDVASDVTVAGRHGNI